MRPALRYNNSYFNVQNRLNFSYLNTRRPNTVAPTSFLKNVINYRQVLVIEIR